MRHEDLDEVPPPVQAEARWPMVAAAVIAIGLDAGGAAARAYGMPRTLDLAFPQQLNPEVAPRPDGGRSSPTTSISD